MKPFSSPEELLNAHELMFGEAGRQCAEIALRWAEILFAVPLDPLNIRIVLAPIELGPYNGHAGYQYGEVENGAFILGNRHIVELKSGTLQLKERSKLWLSGITDFVVHELTHVRQRQLLRQLDKEPGGARGSHRDSGWYQAIAEAAPKYLGIEVPQSAWPRGPRSRKDQGRLTEVDMTHWPNSLRELATMSDPRLPKVRMHINSCASARQSV